MIRGNREALPAMTTYVGLSYQSHSKPFFSILEEIVMNMNKSNVQRVVGMCVIAVLVAAVFPMPGEAADKMILVGTESVKNSMYGKWLTLIFTEAFRRLGYEIQYDGYPAARASAMSDAGEVDGEISRVFEYQDTHPNLIRVDEVLYSTNFVAFAVKPGIVLHGWKSLRNTTYNVEYRRGVKQSESELALVVASEHLSDVKTAEQGLKKLITGRTDLYVDVEFTIVEAIKGLNPDQFDVSAVYQAGIMQEIDAYAYLHKKHTALGPKVAEILKAMKQEGLFESYRKIAFEQP
jgi:polar amino acid transport system substrate-binding protein